MTFLAIVVVCVPAPPTPLVRRTNCDYRPEDSSTIDTIGPTDVFRSKHPVLDPKSIHMVHQRGPNHRVVGGDECDHTANDSYYNTASHAASERIVRIQPLQASREQEEAALITVTVEYIGNEKKTVKTLTHPDGSQTITTTIEEIEDDDAYENDTGCGSVGYESDGGTRSEGSLEDVRLDEEVMRLTQNYSRTAQSMDMEHSYSNVHRTPTSGTPSNIKHDVQLGTTISIPEVGLPSDDLTSSIDQEGSFIPVNTSDDLD